MTHIQAWSEIIGRWMTPVWLPLSPEVKQTLGLKPNVGVYNGMLVTRDGSTGMMEFITRLNSKGIK